MTRTEFIVYRRAGAEAHDIKEWVQPQTPMVRWLSQKLADADPDAFALACWRWVITHIKYPSYSGGARGKYSDRHESHYFLAQATRGGALAAGEALACLVNSWDYWQFPAETLTVRLGDCEDTALVLLSLLRNRFPPERVYCVAGDMLQDGKWAPHAWVELNRGGVFYLMDTTLPQLPEPPWLSADSLTGEYQPFIRFNDVVIREVA